MQRSRKYLDKRQKFTVGRDPQQTKAALELLKSVSRDWESIDLDVRLGINVRKADQNIRGTTILPKGTGKTPRVLVLCKADREEEAKAAGADYVGMEDMLEKIQGVQGRARRIPRRQDGYCACLGGPGAFRDRGPAGEHPPPDGRPDQSQAQHSQGPVRQEHCCFRHPVAERSPRPGELLVGAKHEPRRKDRQN
jgi:hypothetical protein